MLSTTVRWVVGLGFGAVCSVAAGGAGAQDSELPATSMDRPREAFQLSLQGSMFDYHNDTATVDAVANSSSSMAQEVKTSTTGFGFLGSSIGVGVGYAWDQLLLGARAELSSTTTTLSVPGGSDQESSSTTLRLLPRLEYMLTRGTARPYLAGTFGVLHSATSQPVGTSKAESSATLLVVGAAFGIHAFLNSAVSLDPELGVYYGTGSGTAKGTSGSTSVERDYAEKQMQVVFSLGLSAWLDSAPPPAPPPPAPEEHYTPPPALAVAAPAEPEKPVSADIHLPHYRRLYMQVSKDPSRASVLVRLTEPRKEFALATCNEIAVFEGDAALKMEIRSRGPHYLTGRLPLHALELLATTDAAISVCNVPWELGQESREGVATFLKQRRELLDDDDDPELTAPEASPAAPAADPSAPAAPTPPGAVGPSSSGSTPPAATPSAPFPDLPAEKGTAGAPKATAKPKSK